MCYWIRKYTVCRHICTSFSPEILHAGAVKGLTIVFILESIVLIKLVFDWSLFAYIEEMAERGPFSCWCPAESAEICGVL